MLVPSRFTSSTCILGVAVEDWSGRAAVALSADGQYVVIGASRNEGGGPDTAGHEAKGVRVLCSWFQVGDLSGVSVAKSDSGSRIAVGAHLNDGNDTDVISTKLFYYFTQLN
jgi:hypothetical protein